MVCKTPKVKANPEKGSKTIDSATEELLKKACNDYKLSVFKTVKAAVAVQFNGFLILLGDIASALDLNITEEQTKADLTELIKKKFDEEPDLKLEKQCPLCWYLQVQLQAFST
ncbi:hypothetical protein H0H87_003325, partial [Tephrocybe sp. NHM501043]